MNEKKILNVKKWKPKKFGKLMFDGKKNSNFKKDEKEFIGSILIFYINLEEIKKEMNNFWKDFLGLFLILKDLMLSMVNN